MNAETNLKAVLPEILVVDDTPVNLELLTQILSENGYSVRPASGGELALKSALAKVPSLILLDVRMPGMDGFEVCRRLKADSRTRDVPVLFISAKTETADRVKGFEVGGLDYIPKPFKNEELLARVSTHLRLHELSQKLEQMVRERTAELTNANVQLREEIAERRRAEEELQQQAEELQMQTEELRASNDELTRFNRAVVGRELRMVELKKEINELCQSAGQPSRYEVDFDEPQAGGIPAAQPKTKK